MRSWYTDLLEAQRPHRKIDPVAVGSWLHDMISAAAGAFILLMLAFMLAGVNPWRS